MLQSRQLLLSFIFLDNINSDEELKVTIKTKKPELNFSRFFFTLMIPQDIKTSPQIVVKNVCCMIVCVQFIAVQYNTRPRQSVPNFWS